MKKFNLLIVALVLVTMSCKKSILDEYNPSGITDATVFTTPEGFETLVNAAYSYQRWWYGKDEGFSCSEMGTDLWVSGAGDVNVDLMTYINLQGTNRAIILQWENLYAAVNLCNAGINRIADAGFEENTRLRREAELRFLRAFYNWHIVEQWGGVHLTTEETKGIVTTANKTPVDKFYELIISDLEFAINNLPPTTTEIGRVTKPAAMSFLARMYLSNGKNEKANAMARSVIKGNFGFELLSNYADLWKMENLENKEIVYAVNYSTNLSNNDFRIPLIYPEGHTRGSSNSHLLFISRYEDAPGLGRTIQYGRPYQRYAPTRYLLDLFNDVDDSRYEGSFQEVWYASRNSGSIRVGDTAYYCTKKIVTGTKKYKVYDRRATYNADGTIKDRQHYVSLSKFLDPTRTSSNEQQSARDAFVIRFSELYLIAAEAQLKLGRTDSAAYYVNIVRTRAAKPGKVAAMQVTPVQMTLDFILEERAREFAGEQLRWFDLKRTGKLLERIKAYNPDVASSVQDFNVVRPIPQKQLDAVTNKQEFKQNIGYR